MFSPSKEEFESFYNDYTSRQQKSRGRASSIDTSKGLAGLFDREVVNATDRISERISELDERARNVAETFGQGRNAIQGIKNTIADTIPFMISLGFEATKGMQIMSDASEKMGKNLMLDADTIKSLTLVEEVFGLDPSNVIEGFTQAGMSTRQIGTEMEKVQDYLSSVGVPVQKVSQEVVKYMDKMSLYNFSNGVEGLAKMAAKASAMRFDMGQTFSFGEKLLDPKAALDFSNALSRLGITTSSLIDPLRAMQMAFYEPEELQNELGDMLSTIYTLNKEGNKFEINPLARLQLKELAEATGIQVGELQKLALGQAKAQAQGADFISRVRGTKMDIDEKTEQLIRNAAELDEKGEWRINVKGESKLVAELNDADIKQLQEERQAAGLSMEEVARHQMSAIDNIYRVLEARLGTPSYGVAGSETVGRALTLGTDVGKELYKATETDKYKVSDISKSVDMLTVNAADLVTAMVDPNKGLKSVFGDTGDAAGKLTKIFGDAIGSINTTLGEFNTNMSKVNKDYSTIIAPLTNQIGDELKKYLTKISNLPSSVSTPLNNLPTPPTPTIPTQDAIIDLGSQKVQPLPYETIGITPSTEDFEKNILDAIDKNQKTISVEPKVQVNVPPQQPNTELTKSFNDLKNELINKKELTISDIKNALNENKVDMGKGMMGTEFESYFDDFTKQFGNLQTPTTIEKEYKEVEKIYTPNTQIDMGSIVTPLTKIMSIVEKNSNLISLTKNEEVDTLKPFDFDNNKFINSINNAFNNIKLETPKFPLLKLEKDFVTLRSEEFLDNLKKILSGSQLQLKENTVKLDKPDVKLDDKTLPNNINTTLSEGSNKIKESITQGSEKLKSTTIKLENADKIITDLNKSIDKIGDKRISIDEPKNKIMVEEPKIGPLKVEEPKFAGADKIISDFNSGIEKIKDTKLSVIEPKLSTLKVEEPKFADAGKIISDFNSSVEKIKDTKLSVIEPKNKIMVEEPKIGPLKVEEPKFENAENISNTFKSTIEAIGNTKLKIDEESKKINVNVPEFKPIEAPKIELGDLKNLTSSIKVEEPKFSKMEEIISNFNKEFTSSVNKVDNITLDVENNRPIENITEPITNIVSPIKNLDGTIANLKTFIDTMPKVTSLKMEPKEPKILPNINLKPTLPTPNFEQFKPLQNLSMTQTTNNNTNVSGNVSGEIKVRVESSGIDTATLERALKDPTLIAQINKHVIDGVTQNGLMSNAPISPSQKNRGFADFYNMPTA